MRRGLWGALKLETLSSEVARHDRGDWMEHRGVPATPCGDRAEARAPSSALGPTRLSAGRREMGLPVHPLLSLGSRPGLSPCFNMGLEEATRADDRSETSSKPREQS